jgi:hypothetical protein
MSASKKKKPKSTTQQPSDDFVTARRLGADEDKRQFEAMLKMIPKAKPPRPE